MRQPKESKYRQIFEHVYQGIVRGRYRPGSRIPTEAELATRFAASRMTVSRALRDLASHGFLLRRQGAGTFVSGPRSQPAALIGLCLPCFPGFHSAIWDATTMEITRRAQAAGYRLVLGESVEGGVDAALEDPAKICEPFLAQKVACVFFTPAELPSEHMAGNVRIVELFEQARVPVILIDRDICDFPARSGHDLVGVDNVGASYQLTQHLLRLGHRRLHYVGTSAVAATVTARIMGYKMALLDHGIVPDETWVHRGDPRSLDFVRDFVERSSADAFLCSNDHVAAILMRHLASLNVRVPEEVAVVGFDDTPFASLLAPPLTTIRQPGAGLGAAAMRAMLERLADPGLPPREIRLPCELVIRESCGSLRATPTRANRPKRGQKSALRRG